MKQMLSVFAAVLMTILLASACGPTTPAPAQPTQAVKIETTQVVKIETTPTVAEIIAATPTPSEATATTGCPPPAGWSAYTVKQGDTLYALAKQVNQTPEEVMGANCLTSPTIVVGATLYLPMESCTASPPEGWRLYSVRSGDTLSRLATARNTTVAEVKRVNCLVSDSLDVGKQLYLPPAPPASPTLAAPAPAAPAPAGPAPVSQPEVPAAEPGNVSEVTLPSELFSTPIFVPPVTPLCPDAPPGALPAIVTAGLMSSSNRLVLCLYGFPNDRDATVIFYTNDGLLGYDMLRIQPTSAGGGDVVSAQSGAKAGNIISGTSNLIIFPWWPVDLPEMVFVQVTSADKVARQIIRDTDLDRHVGFLRSVPYVPFPDKSFSEGNDCLVVNAPTTLQFLGAGFMNRQRIPIGLYARQSPYTYTLSTSGQALTDGAGRFQFPVVAATGTYLAVADPISQTLAADLWVDCYQFQ